MFETVGSGLSRVWDLLLERGGLSRFEHYLRFYCIVITHSIDAKTA
jgi:hypothetical protein